jgi:hypothetical protein
MSNDTKSKMSGFKNYGIANELEVNVFDINCKSLFRKMPLDNNFYILTNHRIKILLRINSIRCREKVV